MSSQSLRAMLLLSGFIMSVGLITILVIPSVVSGILQYQDKTIPCPHQFRNGRIRRGYR